MTTRPYRYHGSGVRHWAFGSLILVLLAVLLTARNNPFESGLDPHEPSVIPTPTPVALPNVPLSVIPEGFRAMTIKVEAGGGDIIAPGALVDVLAVDDLGGGRQPGVVLEEVKVLAYGDSAVTLLVTPEQAERLALAAMAGRLATGL